MELTILPTEQCNFKCIYCYEKSTPGSMKRWIIDSIKELIENRVKTLNHLRIGWFGGEPLLAKNVIIEIASYATSMLSINSQLFYDSGMSTNGYLLTVETAKELIECGIKEFQISIDGPMEYHDKVRICRDGNGSFLTIWNNLISLRDSNLDFKTNIRVHLSKDNIELLSFLIRDLKKEFIYDKRFKFFFKSIVPLGGDNDSALNCFSENEASEIINSLALSVGDKDSILLKTGASYICYAARPTALVIRCDGRLVKCTVGLDDEENQIGHLQPGGILKIDQSKIRPWLKGAVRLDADALRCPRRYL